MKKKLLLLSSFILCLSIVGCTNNTVSTSTNETTTMNSTSISATNSLPTSVSSVNTENIFLTPNDISQLLGKPWHKK